MMPRQKDAYDLGRLSHLMQFWSGHNRQNMHVFKKYKLVPSHTFSRDKKYQTTEHVLKWDKIIK